MNNKICQICGSNKKVCLYRKQNKYLCNACRCEHDTYNGDIPIYKLPKYGTIEYNPEGKPICHICGKAYKKLLTHVWQKHDLTEKQYKKEFGLDIIKGITAEETKNKLRTAVKQHYNLVVEQNLIKAGRKTRFKEGQEGRTIDKVSPQTLERLKHKDWNGKFKKRHNST